MTSLLWGVPLTYPLTLHSGDTGTTPSAAKGVDQTQTTTTPSSIVKSWGGWRWNELVNELHFDDEN